MADKTLLTLKKIDLAGQIAMIVLPPLYSLVTQGFEAGYAHLLGGVGRLGYWQVVSFLVHIGYGRAPWIAKGRQLYGSCLLLILIGIIFCFIAPFLMFVLAAGFAVIAALIAAMAIFYICITIAELKAMNRIDRTGQHTESNTSSL